MKNLSRYFSLVIIIILIVSACKDPSQEIEVWPKSGYLFTKDEKANTMYVETNTMPVTSPFVPGYLIGDNSKKWTISPAGSGEGVYVHNDRNEYWTIKSVFHPGLKVEQRYVSIIKVTNTDRLGISNRFRYHKSGYKNTFYIESVEFPKNFVAAVGHAESGRGLLLRKQEKGNWEFWLDNVQ
jgi:hypothetical protein